MSVTVRFSRILVLCFAIPAMLALSGGCSSRGGGYSATTPAPLRDQFTSERLVRGFLGEPMVVQDAKATNSLPDNDGDGVPDNRDECPRSPSGVVVDAFGCPVPLYVHLRVTHGDSGPAEPEAFSGQLRGLAELLRENPDSTLRIEGHALGADSQARSLAFAQRARQRLVSEFGVPAVRIEVVGLGQSAPLVSSATPEGRRRNQRLEITLKGVYQAKTPPAVMASQVTQTRLPTSKERMQPKPPATRALAAPVHLRFGYGGDALLPEDQARLRKVAEYLRASPQARIYIVGHTDSQGSAAFNLGLSQRRAQAVQRQLTALHGIEPGRIIVEGKGENEPMADNATEAGRALNRRVTITTAPSAVEQEPTRTSRAAPPRKKQRTALAQAPLKQTAEYAIEVDMKACTLRLYELGAQGRSLVRTYTVATPGPGMPKPSGSGQITGIEFDPWWVPTENIRRRALSKGKRLPQAVAPGSKANPMGKFKMHLSHGAGFRIHGTNDPQRIGQRVSSGCIRMHNDQGLELARAVSVGTPVTFLH
jgi:outer membrane protein OmpA-like peptidoglycan-associated protein